MADVTGIDDAVRDACVARDYALAARCALGGYSTEIRSFLLARHKTRSDAEEVFSMFSEGLWKGLPEFAFRCSVRTWLYTIARHASNRYASAVCNSPQRRQPLPQTDLSGLVDPTRTETRAYRRTDVKERMRALRERMPLEDQTLLILHVDRSLSWRELAVVMHDSDLPLSDQALVTEAARLRKRFERIKATLREMAVSEGILKS